MSNKNTNLISDVLRVMRGETKIPTPLPTAIADAAKKAAWELTYLKEVRTMDTRRDILRKHLAEGLDKCRCTPTTDLAVRFEEEVDSILRSKGLADSPSSVEEAKKSLPPAFLKNIQKKKDAAKKDEKKDDAKSESVEVTEANDNTDKISQKIAQVVNQFADNLHGGAGYSINELPKMRSYSGRAMYGKYCLGVSVEGFLMADLLKAFKRHGIPEPSKDALGRGAILYWQSIPYDAKVHKNTIRDPEDDDIDEQTRGRTDPLTEAKKRKPYEEVYYKWFDRVQVDLMDTTKIAKEIQAALDSKADLEKVMPELVAKYRKN